MTIDKLIYFISGVFLSIGVFGILFTTPLLNHYGANGMFLGEENLVCFNPISIFEGGVEQTIYHEECHVLIKKEYNHFCEFEGAIKI